MKKTNLIPDHGEENQGLVNGKREKTNESNTYESVTDELSNVLGDSDYENTEKQYLKTTSDMKRLTQIEEKQKKGEELTKDELVFLYEIDNTIEGFGNKKDPRIEAIKNQRDTNHDLNIAIYEGLENLYLGGVKKIKGVKFPNSLKRLNLDCIEIIEGVEFTEGIEEISLSSVKKIKEVKFPNSLKRLWLTSITTIQGVVLPSSLEYLDLSGAEVIERSQLPKGLKILEIGGDITIRSSEGPRNVEIFDKYSEYDYIKRKDIDYDEDIDHEHIDHLILKGDYKNIKNVNRRKWYPKSKYYISDRFGKKFRF